MFELIAELGEVAEDEMYEVFNMGCGFVCVVAAADAEARRAAAARALPGREADRHASPSRGGGRRARPSGGLAGANDAGRRCGVVDVARRKCSRSEGAEPKPARAATCSTGRSVCSSRRRASSTRWACSQRSGVVPVSATKRRAKVRGLTAARAASVATSSGSARWSSAQARTGSSEPAPSRGRQRPLDELRLAAVAVRRRRPSPARPWRRPARRGRSGPGAGRGRSPPRGRPRSSTSPSST